MLAFALSMMLFAAQTPQAGAEESPAAPEAAAASTTTAKTQADPGRLICRRESKANSRFTTKICKTAEEWEERAEAARQAFGETQNRPIVSTDKGS